MRCAVARYAALIGLAVALAACDTVGGAYDALFGTPYEEILPGQRIAILALDRGLRPDPSVADVRVRLSEPYVNQTWTHLGGSATHAMYHLSLGDAPRRVWSEDIGEPRRL